MPVVASIWEFHDRTATIARPFMPSHAWCEAGHHLAQHAILLHGQRIIAPPILGAKRAKHIGQRGRRLLVVGWWLREKRSRRSTFNTLALRHPDKLRRITP
jgi:hypothetical protein